MEDTFAMASAFRSYISYEVNLEIVGATVRPPNAEV